MIVFPPELSPCGISDPDTYHQIYPMKESFIPVTLPADPKLMPLHEDIAQCAQQLWVQYGKPADRDLAIWLEAEHLVHSAPSAQREIEPPPVTPAKKSPKKSAHL
jgi:hypothetical protein